MPEAIVAWYNEPAGPISCTTIVKSLVGLSPPYKLPLIVIVSPIAYPAPPVALLI